MSASLFCPYCGAANSAQDQICFACQRSLTEASEQDDVATPLPAKMVGGRYRLLSLLGSGGSGAVYKALDTKIHDRVIAVKEISFRRLTIAETREATEAFHREVQLLSGLNHPSLPTIFDEFEEKGQCYLVMDFIDGVTLETYCEQQGGKLAVDEALTTALSMCEALDYLHSRRPPIIFRDLKPSNVMRTSHGHLYLIDFGIARHFNPGQVKDTIPFGSPGYAAPEQYGRSQTTPRSDIYSLGATLHYLLTGTDPSIQPFQFTPLSSLHPPIDNADLDHLIQRMVAVDINRRPVDIQEVQAQLRGIQQRWLASSSTPRRVYKAVQTPQRPQSGMPVTASPIAGDVSSRQVQVQLPGSAAAPRRLNRRTALGLIAGVGGGVLLVTSGLTALHTFFTPKYVVGVVQKAAVPSPAARVPYTSYVVFSPHGKYLALSQNNGDVLILSYPDGEQATKFNLLAPGSYAAAPTLAWSPDSTRLAVSYPNQSIQILDWNGVIKRIVYTYRGHSQFGAATIAWSPDGSSMASVVASEFQVWRVTDGKLLFHSDLSKLFPANSYGQVQTISWSSDGQRLALGTSLDVSASSSSLQNDYAVYWYDVRQQRQTGSRYLGRFQDFNFYFSVAWCPHSPYIAAFINNTLWLLDSDHQQASDQVFKQFLPQIDTQTTPDAQQLAWSPDGHILALATSTSIAVWNRDSKNTSFYDTSDLVSGLSWQADGKHINYYTIDGQAKTLTLGSGAVT